MLELSGMGRLAALVCSVLALAYLFARVEVEIEGEGGWAANLPTWRIEQHPLLDIFMGGRALTGYHLWMFAFIGLVFHFPLFLTGRWTLQLEASIMASIMLFWIVEDYLWFVVNPAFGWRRFKQEHVSWHKHWALGAPIDYWIFGAISMLLFWYGA